MRRLFWLAGLAYLLLLVGLATLRGTIIVLTLPPTIYLTAALLRGPGELHVTARRSMDAACVAEGRPVVVEVTVTNQGGELELVRIEDTLPPKLHVVEGSSSLLTSLRPGQSATLAYRVEGERGDVQLGPVRVAASDVLNLFSRQVALDTPQRLTILCEAKYLRRVKIRPRFTRAYAGPVPALEGGAGIEFFGIRSYQMGDPLRWINWKVSARHRPSLFTNEFEQERITDVGLILDARRRTDIRGADTTLFEHSVSATASLAARFLGDGDRVGLLIYGGFLKWTFPGYGRIQRERILRALAGAETGESLVFENLDYIPTRSFRAKSQLVLVSPLCADDVAPLVRLRARGYELAVISPDPISFEAKTLPRSGAVSLAVRIAQLERRAVLRRLRRAGIRTVDWRVDTSFDTAIHAALSRGPHTMRAIGVD